MANGSVIGSFDGPPRAVWVLVREHGDKSGETEILRVYANEARAKYDLKITEGDYGMRYRLIYAPLYLGDGS